MTPVQQLVHDITTPLINWCGAHPGTFLLAFLGGLAALIIFAADVYCSWKLAGLKARYPRPKTINDPQRPPEIAERMARLDFLVRTFEGWYRKLCAAPIIGHWLPDLPEREDSDVSILHLPDAK